jgi:2-oxoglutarate ferredoxin oxidoreductase subunit alpha
MMGDAAIAEGAIAAGCRYFGGYPITPSTETAERMSVRLPQIGGTYMQMEDELASIASVLGASWGGKKSMTTTSGPGFSLMMENLGLGIITETPAVICNVQRGGPSTGLPTAVAQGDMMQAKWGSHGDYEIIALVPWSVQECFDLTIRAFNLAEKYRTPVLLMTDAEVGHLTERLVIPEQEEIELWDRKPPIKPPGEYKTYEPDDDLIPPMAPTGQGYHVFCESLTHDERGYPNMSVEAQAKLQDRLVAKIRNNRFDIYDNVETDIDDADVVVISYGISSRISVRAIDLAQERGLKIGHMRLRTVWPFPAERVREISENVRGIVVPEINLGQIVHEVERAAAPRCGIQSVPHPGGEIHEPETILEAIVKTAEGNAPLPGELVTA